MPEGHRYLNSHPGLARKENTIYRNMCMLAKTENREFKNVRAFVNMTEVEKKYISFSTFASDYAKSNGYPECIVTGFGKCFSDTEIEHRRVYAI